jgi:hypothetical protein
MKKQMVIIFMFLLQVAAAQEKGSTSIYESLQLPSPKAKVNPPTKKIIPKMVSVEYNVPYYDTANHNVWYNAFKEGKVMEQVADMLNKMFKLKQKMKITCLECGKVNAYYNPEDKELKICYELFADMYQKMSRYHNDPDSVGEKIGKAFNFVLYHEVGHALIDVLDIPLTGKEEDAADYFSFFLMGGFGDEYGIEVCREGANFFKDMHEELKKDTVFQRLNQQGEIFDNLPFWDEHSFDLQRYYSINSLIFGSDPYRWDGIIDIGYRRPVNAIDEFNKIKRGWSRLLLPHLRIENENNNSKPKPKPKAKTTSKN